MAVPTVRVKPERPVKGITTASDYVAPRELPAHTPRPAETAAAKVVIHVPDAARGDEPAAGAAPSEAEVAELRQRRRAPTLKIDRNAVKELKALDDARAAAALAQIIDPGAGTSSRNTAAPLVTDTGVARMGRPLARPAAERPSPRRAGWIVALLATAVVGVGALAIGLGWVPGLSPVEDPPAAAAPPATEPAGEPTPPAPSPAATTEPEATAAPTPSETASPSATPPPPSAASTPAASSAPPAASSAPRPAPWPGGRPPPRPRPKSDIPTGI